MEEEKEEKGFIETGEELKNLRKGEDPKEDNLWGPFNRYHDGG